MTEEDFDAMFASVLPENARAFVLPAHGTASRFHCVFADAEMAWDLVNRMRAVAPEDTRISHFCPREELERMRSWNLFLGGVRGQTSSELATIFERYGRILSLSRQPGNRAVLVQYINEEGYSRAKNMIARDYPEMSVIMRRDAGCVVYYLQPGINEAEIRALFPAANDVRIDRVKQPGMRPVVFLRFPSLDDCEAAMRDCLEQFSGQHRLFCTSQLTDCKAAFALVNQNARTYQFRNTIYVPRFVNLPSVTQEDVVKAAGVFGRINSCVLLGQPKKLFAYVAFETSAGYRAALEAGLTIRGHKVPVLSSTTNLPEECTDE
jgi:hypothetical protein